MTGDAPVCWAIVPAAGVGRRMGSEAPKQYLLLQGQTILDRTIGRLLEVPQIRQLRVVVSADDGWWGASLFSADSRVVRVTGGAERCHSVLNALHALSTTASADDWVLVHDAARPCVRPADIGRLIAALSGHSVGGLLAVPLHDTIKQATSEGRVQATLPRETLWRAYTPQMFRLGELTQALKQALGAGQRVTDEASAMELAGWQPLLVEGAADNIKITRPEDLELAAFYLQRQRAEGRGPRAKE